MAIKFNLRRLNNVKCAKSKSHPNLSAILNMVPATNFSV